MPKRMPRLDRSLRAQADSALGVVVAGEHSCFNSDRATRRAWHITRLEALYELAFLRVFAAWEVCLEEIMCRSLCGYRSKSGREKLTGGLGHFRTISAAQLAILNGQ